MTDKPITVGPEQLRDQKQKMVEEWDVSEEKAEKVFTDVKTQVSLQAQELDKDWDTETLNEVTNLVIAIQQQSYENIQRRKSHFYGRLYNLFAGMLLAGMAGVVGVLVHAGDYTSAAVAGAVLITIILMHALHG